MELRFGLILLAAGGATRMGAAKQFLPYQGRSLLRHAAEVAVASGLTPVVAVLGAQADRLEPELAGLHVEIVTNDEWAKGMGSSIRAGMRAMRAAAAGVEAVVFTVCDQPLVGPDVIGRLVEGYLVTGKPVVASEYRRMLGVPALFARRYFPQLAGLADGEGAKRLIAGAGNAVHAVPFPGGAFDIDTPQDYERLQAMEGGLQPANLFVQTRNAPLTTED